MKKWIISIVFVLCVLGCTKEINEQGQTTWKLDPIRTEQVESAIESGASLLSVVYPPAGAAAVAILGALGIWRKKIKPNYEKAKTEANLYHTSTHTLVQVIEAIKKDEPELWEKIEPFMDSRIGTNTENVIRAIRGLPAKE